MIKGTSHLRIFGVALLAALGLMAFAVASAQADEFEINGTPLLELGEEESFAAVAGQIELLTAGGIVFKCDEAEAEGTIHSHGFVEATVNFFGNCEVLNNPHCEVDEPLIAEGEGEVILHGTGAEHEAYIVAEDPVEFTTIFFLGELCTLPEENVVKGSAALLVLNALELESVKHLDTIDLATSALLGVQLFLGNELAHLSPGVLVETELTGDHAGEPFAIIPLISG